MSRVLGSILALVALLAMFLTPARAALDVQVAGVGGNEPTDAIVSPVSPNIVVVAQFLQASISTDFGRTFPNTVSVPIPNAATLVEPGVASWRGCGDASMAFDATGRLFMTYLLCGFDNAAPTPNRVEITVMVQEINVNTAATVGNPVNLTPGNFNDDKEWIAADKNPASPFANNLYVVWTRLGSPSQIMFVRSTNGGANWSAPQALSANGEGFVWPSHVAVAPNGDVYAAYHSDTCGATTASVFVLRDSTGGANWANGTIGQKTSFQSAVTCNVQTTTNTVAGTAFWMQGANQPFILPDPVRPGNIYVVANDDPNNDFSTATGGDGGDVILARSTDNGNTWNLSTISHAPAGTLQVMPTGAIDQLGNIVMTWYDTRRGLTNAAGNFLLDLYSTVSQDGGVTFSNDIRVNDASFDPDINAPCRFGCNAAAGDPPPVTERIGEYNGVAAANGVAYAVWAGNQNSSPLGGNQRIYFDAYSMAAAFSDAAEPNDAFNPGVASVLGADGTYNVQNLTIHSDTDEDFFKVTALNTGKLTFQIHYNSRFSDLDIAVHDKFNNTIATATATTDTNDVETLIVPAVQGESYFLRVFPQAGQVPPINTYDLSIVNTAAPVPFAIMLAPGSDTGSSASDNITKQNMPTIQLAVDLNPLNGLNFSPTNDTTLSDDAPGYKVGVFANGTPVGFAQPVLGQPGIFTYTFTTPLDDGLNLITARVFIVDNAAGAGGPHAVGQGGESGALAVTIDTQAPDATALGPLDLLPSSDTGGINDDNITTFSTPSFTVPVSAPGFVRIYATNLQDSSTTQVAQFQVTNPQVWQFTVASLNDGVYNMTATIEDTAGNVGPATIPLKITIAKYSLTLPGLTTSAASGTVMVDLTSGTISGYASANSGNLIGITGIPVVNLDTGGNNLTMLGTAADDAIAYSPLNTNTGSVSYALTGQVFNVTTTGNLTIDPKAGNDTVTVKGTAANDTINVTVQPTTNVQLGTTKALNLPTANVEKLAISTGQGNDTINVNIYNSATANLFVDGGEPSTVNKGNDQLNLVDQSGGGQYQNISAGSVAGSGAIVLKYPKTTTNATRVDYAGIEKTTRK